MSAPVPAPLESPSGPGKRLSLWLPVLLLPWLALLAINWANGAPMDVARVAEAGVFSMLALTFAWEVQRQVRGQARRRLWIPVVAAAASAALAFGQPDDLLAFILVAALFAALIHLAGWMFARLGVVWRLAGYAGMSLVAGGAVIALNQIATSFAEEEFFAAVSMAQLALVWLALLAADRARRSLRTEASEEPPAPRHSRISVGLLAVGMIGLIFWTVNRYQNSFYGQQPPEYAGITAEQPFVCGKSEAADEAIPGAQVHRRLLEQVAANPKQGPSEYGLLAVQPEAVRPPGDWAGRFHQSLLDEARQGLYTGPAYSVKYGQCMASQRVFSYSRVRRSLPDLFSPAEQDEIAAWMRAVNRRALTVEPIDWFYALAFRDWPEGPYENQECGAALLAILEAEGLADPALSARNHAYLDQQRRGWQSRFRNNDDAYFYQLEWLRNAYYQSLLTGPIDADLQARAFEWYLYQSLPDGTPLRYNHVSGASAAQIAYWAAGALERPDFLWLANRSIENAGSRGVPASAGMDLPLVFDARPPEWGSCLLYGQTGLPTRLGPLAPDKIVFRGGWEADDLYLLMNLRFTGWHRYKATNTVSLVYQGGPLAGEDNTGEPYAWLPQGRALFRDKRIPRQNLNGLLIPRAGLDQALYHLLGGGGPWAQDPPYYARVEEFQPGPGEGVSVTTLDDWHGWRHSREVHFFDSGAVVFIDDVSGPANQQAALAWHLYHLPQPRAPAASEASRLLGRYAIREGDQPAEMVLIDLYPDPQPVVVDIQTGENEMSALFVRPQSGGFTVATVFLTQAWVGANVSWDESRNTLVIAGQTGRIEVFYR